MSGDTAPRRYYVRYSVDESGVWFAGVDGVPGCHTQGATLHIVRARITEALFACVSDAHDAVLCESYSVPIALLRAELSGTDDEGDEGGA